MFLVRNPFGKSFIGFTDFSKAKDIYFPNVFHKLTGTPTTCWRCGPHALATPWPLLQLLARYHPMPTAEATPEQHRWLRTHFEQAAEGDTATVAWDLSAKAE